MIVIVVKGEGKTRRVEIAAPPAADEPLSSHLRVALRHRVVYTTRNGEHAEVVASFLRTQDDTVLRAVWERGA